MFFVEKEWEGKKKPVRLKNLHHITKDLLITTTADFTSTCRWEYTVDVLNTTSSGISNFHFGHTYTHFKKCRIWRFPWIYELIFLLVHLILLFHLCFPPESSLADCSERSSRWKAKSCRRIWSHASCSWSVTVYSHSQLTVPPPQTYVHTHTQSHKLIFSDGKESLLRWRQPLWINSADPYSLETFTASRRHSAAQVAHRARGFQRAASRRRITEQNGFLNKLNLRLLSYISVNYFSLLTLWINVLQAHFSDISSSTVWVWKADHFNLDTKFLSHQRTKSHGVTESLISTPKFFFFFYVSDTVTKLSCMRPQRHLASLLMMQWCHPNSSNYHQPKPVIIIFLI